MPNPHPHFADEQTEAQRRGSPCPRSPSELRAEPGLPIPAPGPSQRLALPALSCMYACEGRVCQRVHYASRGGPSTVCPRPSLHCGQGMSLSACACVGGTSLGQPVPPHVCVDVAWCGISGGIDMTVYSAHACRGYVCLCGGEGVRHAGLFPSLVSSPQLRAGRVRLSWSKMTLLDQGFWACRPDPNPNPSLCPTPLPPDPLHLSPGPQTPPLETRAASPKVIISVELRIGPVSWGCLHAPV